MLQNVCENCIQSFGRKEAPSAPYVRYLVKKVKKTVILIDKPKREKPKTVRTPENIVAVAESVCEATFTSNVILNNWTFRRHHWDKFCIKTLVWHHTKFNWFRSCSQLTIQCVFASLSGPAIDLQKMQNASKIVEFGAQKTRTHILKSRRTQNESLFGEDYRPEA